MSSDAPIRSEKATAILAKIDATLSPAVRQQIKIDIAADKQNLTKIRGRVILKPARDRGEGQPV